MFFKLKKKKDNYTGGNRPNHIQNIQAIGPNINIYNNYV